ncbi:MAG: gamma-glutamyl-gamma-aminobutyrate hydrolase family protein [Christensenellaceae bacterium]|jgi:putative glutamine amidotransferase|nr:gamma-glutamyl-gamma-aminobutyrate hydrolase family protein [Christensenellaceae bacterium]
MKPLVAIASNIEGDLAPPPFYAQAVTQAGGRPQELGPVVGENLPGLLGRFDALVLCGGNDIDPCFFGQKRHPAAKLCARQRDETELLLAKAFFDAKKPILAICRGLQVLNVALGGDLHQHIYDLPGTRLLHSSFYLRHGIAVERDSLLGGIFGGRERLVVNSTHHQALARVAEGLRVIARSEDGLVEAVQHGDLVLGTQFHPERMLLEGHAPIFDWFIARAGAAAEVKG